MHSADGQWDKQRGQDKQEDCDGADIGHGSPTFSAKRNGSNSMRAEDTRRRLFEAAIEQFSDRHYREVAVNVVAEEQALTTFGVPLLPKSKRGIYLQAMRQAARGLAMAPS
jgi:hypothetical protein